MKHRERENGTILPIGESETGVMQDIASSTQLRISFMRWVLFATPFCVGLGFLSEIAAQRGLALSCLGLTKDPAYSALPLSFPLELPLLLGLLGLALAFVGSARGAQQRAAAFGACVVQLLLGLAWNFLFYDSHWANFSLLVIGLQVTVSVMAIVLAWRVRRIAGALLLPYLIWGCLALSANFAAIDPNSANHGLGEPCAAVRVQL